MLKYEHSGMTDRLELQGSVDDIIAEVTYLVRRVHEVIKKKDSDAAESYKELVMQIVGDPESPVWVDKTDMTDKLIEKLEGILKMLKPEEAE